MRFAAHSTATFNKIMSNAEQLMAHIKAEQLNNIENSWKFIGIHSEFGSIGPKSIGIPRESCSALDIMRGGPGPDVNEREWGSFSDVAFVMIRLLRLSAGAHHGPRLERFPTNSYDFPMNSYDFPMTFL